VSFPRLNLTSAGMRNISARRTRKLYLLERKEASFIRLIGTGRCRRYQLHSGSKDCEATFTKRVINRWWSQKTAKSRATIKIDAHWFGSRAVWASESVTVYFRCGTLSVPHSKVAVHRRDSYSKYQHTPPKIKFV